MRRPNRVVIDSTATLQKNARPINGLRRNLQACTLIVDKKTAELLAGLLKHKVVDWPKAIQITDLETGLVIALDKNGDFCGAYNPCVNTWPLTK